MTHRILQFMLGNDGGTERFFVKLANAFHEAGAKQRFLVRPNRVWQAEIADCGRLHWGYNPASPVLQWRMKQLTRRWKPDMILAWRAPQSKLIPDDSHPLRLTRQGDNPIHLRNFSNNDALVANVPTIRDHCLSLGWDRPVHLISNFATLNAPRPLDRRLLDTPKDAHVVCGVGRFDRTKGFQELVRAVAPHDDIWLWLVGDGNEREALGQLVDELGMAGRTRFAGWVENSQDYIAAANQFCIPSQREALGNVLLEAWAGGIPSVSTRFDGARWYATHEKDCLLVDIDDVGAMSQSIRRIRDNPALARALVAGAHETLETKFSKRAIVGQYFDLIEAHKAARI